MNGRTIAAVAAALAVFPSGALARGEHRRSAMTEARAAAVEYWGGQPPCVGGVRIAYSSRPPTNDTDGVRVGTVSAWTTSLTTSTAGVYQDCLITLNDTEWAPSLQSGDFPAFCGLMVHEYGHLFGHPDRAGDSPRSIKYPVVGPLNERVRPCVRRYPDVNMGVSIG